MARLQTKALRLEEQVLAIAAGAQRQLLMMERVKIKKLIERLERGEKVDPAEIEALWEK